MNIENKNLYAKNKAVCTNVFLFLWICHHKWRKTHTGEKERPVDRYVTVKMFHNSLWLMVANDEKAVSFSRRISNSLELSGRSVFAANNASCQWRCMRIRWSTHVSLPDGDMRVLQKEVHLFISEMDFMNYFQWFERRIINLQSLNVHSMLNEIRNACDLKLPLIT